MKKSMIIENENATIPAVIWGPKSDKILLLVHGQYSHKEDPVLVCVAENAIRAGYQVLSFDLPEHGQRKRFKDLMTPQQCLLDLKTVYDYARTLGTSLSVFACSIGAYYSLLAYEKKSIDKLLMLSPLLNMKSLIETMMSAYKVDEKSLEEKGRIPLDNGQVLDWDYYQFVINHPLGLQTAKDIYILYGQMDDLCSKKDLMAFVEDHKVHVMMDEQGQHFYHTPSHLQTIDKWLKTIF